MLPRLQQYIRSRWPFQFLLLTIWVIWLGQMILEGVIIPNGMHAGIDYLAFYSSGQLAIEGKAGLVYDESSQQQMQQRIPGITSGIMHFLNPPPFLLVCTPLALLPFHSSLLVWSLLSLCMLVLSVSFLTGRWNLRYLLLALCFFPVFAAIKNGQSSIFGLFLLSTTFALLKKEQLFFAGLVASALIYKPFFALGLAAWLLFNPKRYWTVIAGGVVGGAVLTVTSYLLFPEAWPAFREFSAKALAHWIYQVDYPIRIQYTMRGFVLNLIPNARMLAEVLGYGVTAGSLILAVLMCRREATLEGKFAWTTMASVVGAPYLLIHDWTLVLIPAFLWWQSMSSDKYLFWATFLVWTLSWVGRVILEIQFAFSPFVLHLPYIGLCVATLLMVRALPSPGGLRYEHLDHHPGTQ